MTDPASAPDRDGAAAEVSRRLAAGGGVQLARGIGWLRDAIRVVAALASATGLVALALGWAAWGSAPIGVLVTLAACVPAVAAPIYVARRTGALARAAAHPRELADQARDLISGLRSSPALEALAGRLHQGDAGTARRPPRAGRFTRSLGLLRLVSDVVGQARPDPQRHPLLVPFRPERLRATWLAIIVSLWAWLAASLVALAAGVVLLARLV